MGFGQTPNQESGPIERGDEPSIEEQEGVSGLFGKQAQNRIQGIQRNLDSMPDRQNLGASNSSTGLGGLEKARNVVKPSYFAQQEVFEQLGGLEEDNQTKWKHKGNMGAEAAYRGTENSRARLSKQSKGIENKDTQEVVEQKTEQLEEALTLLREELGLEDIEQIVEELKKPGGEEKIRGVLSKILEKEWVDGFIARLLSEQTEQELGTLRRLRLMEQTALEDTGLFDQILEAEDMDAFMEENKDKVKAFRDFIQEEERLQKLDEDYQQRKELEHAESALQEAVPRALSAAATVMLLEFGVNSDVLSQLPPEGVSAVESVASRGGGEDARSAARQWSLAR